jgi:hypothetical protein
MKHYGLTLFQRATSKCELKPILGQTPRASGVREIFYGEDWKYSEEIERVYRTLSDQFDSFSRMGISSLSL